MLNPRTVSEQETNSRVIGAINSFISTPLLKIAIPFSLLAPIFGYIYIIPVMYAIWGGIALLGVFGVSLISSHLLNISLSEVITPWIALATDISGQLITPIGIATTVAVFYVIAIYTEPPNQTGMTNADYPEKHSNKKFIVYFILSLIGVGVFTVSATVGFIITVIGAGLTMLHIRLLIQSDTNARYVYYNTSTWLIITRLWVIWAVPYALFGGSITVALIAAFGTFLGAAYFLSRRDLTRENSLYTRIQSLTELIEIDPRTFGHLTGATSVETPSTDNLAEAKDLLSSPVSHGNDILIEDLYHAVLEFEDEYTRYTDADDVDAEKVYEMGKSDIKRLHSKATRIEADDNASLQLQSAAGRLRRKTEEALQDWD